MLHDHEFEAPIEAVGYGRATYHYLFFPDDVLKELPFGRRSKLRLEVSLGDLDLPMSLQPVMGRKAVMVGRKTLKKLGLEPGEIVRVRFRVVDDDHVDVPEALTKLLDTDDDVRASWHDSTPGRRRGWAYMVSSAKRPETVAKRLKEVRKQILE